MAESRKLIWVKVDRDRSPEVVKRYNIEAYPTLLTLGDKDEKVHRFSGFKKPDDFLAELRDALRRHALHRKGEEWDEPEPRPERIADEGKLTAVPAPSEEVPEGLAVLGGRLRVAQGGRLYTIDPVDGKVLAEAALPEGTRGLCTDGKLLYALHYGWTAGKPITVIDPGGGETRREIVTEENTKNKAYGAAGIAWREGRLLVLEGMGGTIHEVDPGTGKVSRSIRTDQRWLSGLAWDGRHLIAGSREALCLLDPETGQTVRKVPVHYPIRAIAADQGACLLMEQPVFSHDRQHRRVRLWPRKTLIHRLVLPG